MLTKVTKGKISSLSLFFFFLFACPFLFFRCEVLAFILSSFILIREGLFANRIVWIFYLKYCVFTFSYVDTGWFIEDKRRILQPTDKSLEGHRKLKYFAFTFETLTALFVRLSNSCDTVHYEFVLLETILQDRCWGEVGIFDPRCTSWKISSENAIRRCSENRKKVVSNLKSTEKCITNRSASQMHQINLFGE